MCIKFNAIKTKYCVNSMHVFIESILTIENKDKYILIDKNNVHKPLP